MQIITVMVCNGTKSILSFTEIGQLSQKLLMLLYKREEKTGTLILLWGFLP
jgi:hypothetical protein